MMNEVLDRLEKMAVRIRMADSFSSPNMEQVSDDILKVLAVIHAVLDGEENGELYPPRVQDALTELEQQ